MHTHAVAMIERPIHTAGRDGGDEFIPILRQCERLGFGVRSARTLYRWAKSDPAFPPLWLVGHRNFIRASDAAAYRAVLRERGVLPQLERIGDEQDT